MSIDSQTDGAVTRRRTLAHLFRLGPLREYLSTRLPLVALTLLVLVAHVVGYLGREAARNKNLKILNPGSELEFKQALSADPAIGMQTQAMLVRPCRVIAVASCDTFELDEGRMMERIRAGATDAMLRQRLAKKKYSNASELFRELINERHHGSVTNAVTAAFGGSRRDATSLIAFAVFWNLEPALAYRAVGREDDALEQFQFFTDMTLPVVRRGHWVSASGLDVTDLPVIHNAFCSGPDPLKTKRCSWALLNAFAETVDSKAGMRLRTAFEVDTVTEYDLEAWSTNRGGLDLSSAYGRQSPLFASPIVSSYLNAIGHLSLRQAAEAHEILRTIPVFASPAQEALWYYQLGRSALLVAAWHGIADCQRFKREATAAFSHSIQADDIGLLASPAAARRSETSGICASSN